jgi:hypothetical protein
MGNRIGDMIFSLLDGCLIDQRSDDDTILETVPNLHRLDRGLQLFCKRVIDAVLHQEPVRADAGLTRIAIFRRQRALNSGVQIRIVEDNEGRIPAQLHAGLLDRGRALGEERRAHLGRAGEAQFAHVRAGRQFAADHAAWAGDDIAYACGKTGTLGQDADGDGREGVWLAGRRMPVQPAAQPGPALRVIIAAGKFHGVMAAKTPIGSFCTMMRRPGRCCGMVSP